MPTPARFTIGDFLDAALLEIGQSGVDGVSLAAIGRRVGASNGSLYHRFPTRQHLLGRLWVQVASSYRDTLVAAVEDTTIEGAAAAIVGHTFDWVEANPARAEVLMRFRTEDFVAGDWPDEILLEVRTTNEELNRVIADFAARVGIDLLDAVLAVIDVPAAAARRGLLLGGDPRSSARLRRRAEDLVSLLLDTTA